MADRTIAAPTVETLKNRAHLMQHTLLRIIRNTSRNVTIPAETRLARIAWLADAGLFGPLDDETGVLYDELERSLERVANIFHRLDPTRAVP